MDHPELILAISIVLMAMIVWAVVAASHDFRVIIADGRVWFRGRFPPERRAAVAQFFQSDLQLPGKVRVIGRWRAGRVLKLTFRGNIPAGEQQRIRNFLAMALR